MVCETPSAIPVNGFPNAAAGQGTRQEAIASRVSQADRHGMRQASLLPGIVQRCYLYSIKLESRFPEELSLQNFLANVITAYIEATASQIFGIDAFQKS